ncbi:hypothetical protein CCACVL1_23441 [Corchorus capsularis]|uniref:Peptidase A1 domain-containing protein n=1 Tax=Corchorus capsularis TaxID=210143 RepID=A0A1R3GTW5_COCAP|nr:hypothetical protein CCACVL1_23441 [Corchorus capsularis]
MAAATTTISSTFLSALLLLFLVCSLKEGYALGLGRRCRSMTATSFSIDIPSMSTLFFLPTCHSSAQASDKKSSLRVVHKHGPCSRLHQDKATIPTHAEILRQDEARVKSIHSKFANNKGQGSINDAANLPDNDGSVVGSGNYIVTMGLGTPKKDYSLIFDTGVTSLGHNASLAQDLAINSRTQFLIPPFPLHIPTFHAFNNLQCHSLPPQVN